MLRQESRYESLASQTASDSLCANISQGIHAAAQPLSILRASLDKDITDRMGLRELRNLAITLAAQVERVCSLFTCMQQIINADSVRPLLVATSIVPLLTYVSDGIQLLFEEDRIILKSTIQGDLVDVLVDRERTLQALTSIMLLIHGVSKVEETVELEVSNSFDQIHIVIQNRRAYVDSLSAEANLRMSLAETNIRSQGGEFSCYLKPLNVRIDLIQAHLCFNGHA